MVTSHFQLSMEWSKYKYIILYRNKCCKDSIDTGKFTANHKESNIYIRNLPLNEILLLYHYRSCNFAHCPPFCTIRQLTYIDCALISAKMNRYLTIVYNGPRHPDATDLTRDNSPRESWRQGHPDARDILTLGTSWRQKLQTFALCFFSFSSFRFSALRHSYAFND